jgi:hypothetical protein
MGGVRMASREEERSGTIWRSEAATATMDHEEGWGSAERKSRQAAEKLSGSAV